MLVSMNDAPTAKKQNYLRYGVLLGLLAVIRVFEAVTAGAPWRTIDSRWMLTLCALAVVVSLVTCLLTRRTFAPVTAVLLSGLAGGTTTLVANSIPGMVIGVCIGVFAAFDAMQRFSLRALAFVGMYLLPALAFGWGVGYFGAKWSWLRVQVADEWPVIIAVISMLCVFGVAWPIVISLWRKQKPTHLVWKIPLVLLITVVAEPFGVSHDTTRRGNLLSTVDAYAYSSVPPSSGIAPEIFTRGFYYFTNLIIQKGLPREVGKELRDIHTIAHVYVQPSYEKRELPFQNEGFEDAELREVIELAVGANRQFNDTALRGFGNCERLTTIMIYGGESPITDEGLTALQRMKSLSLFTLEGAKIDGSGLQHLHPNAPLVTVSLSNTNVGDKALKHLAKYTLASLGLRGTQVTGEGLKHFHDDPTYGLDSLDLSLSQFDEAYIKLLPSSLNSLQIDGIRLSQSGVEAFAVRFPDGLTHLSIAGSGIDDTSLARLAALKLPSLRVDASQLTSESAEVLARVPDLELNYNAESWFAAGKTLEDLVAHRDEMEAAIGEWRRQLVLGYSSGFMTTIDNLVVSADMVELLRRIPQCNLIQARIESGPLYVEGESVLQDLEPADLLRWFPRTTGVE